MSALDTSHRGTEAPRNRSVASVSRSLGVSRSSSRLRSTSAVAAAGDLRLIEAVKARNAEAVRSLLKERVDVNARQGDGATALHWAVHLDDAECGGSAVASRRQGRCRGRHRRDAALSRVPESPGSAGRATPPGARQSERRTRQRRDGADDVRADRRGCRRARAAGARRERQREGTRPRSDRADVGRRAGTSRGRGRAAAKAAPTSARDREATSRPSRAR